VLQAVICRALATFCSTCSAVAAQDPSNPVPLTTTLQQQQQQLLHHHNQYHHHQQQQQQEQQAPAPAPGGAVFQPALDACGQRIAADVLLLLDSGDTGPALLRPLLQLLLFVLEATPAAGQAQLADLVDILLGWSLDPEVTLSDR
jgi:hypothetical protein